MTSEAIGMDQAQQVIAENNVETYWDKTTSQNYGTYDVDNSTYQIWLEDSQSCRESEAGVQIWTGRCFCMEAGIREQWNLAGDY